MIRAQQETNKGNKKMFMIGKRPLTETQKAEQAARFEKKTHNPKFNNAKLISEMRTKLAAK